MIVIRLTASFIMYMVSIITLAGYHMKVVQRTTTVIVFVLSPLIIIIGPIHQIASTVFSVIFDYVIVVPSRGLAATTISIMDIYRMGSLIVRNTLCSIRVIRAISRRIKARIRNRRRRNILRSNILILSDSLLFQSLFFLHHFLASISSSSNCFFLFSSSCNLLANNSSSSVYRRPSFFFFSSFNFSSFKSFKA